MSLVRTIRAVRAWSVLLLASWLMGTSILATCHDHDPAGWGPRVGATEPTSSATPGPCLMCRVSSQTVVLQVAPIAERVPDAPPGVARTPASRVSHDLAFGMTRLRSPPCLPVEA